MTGETLLSPVMGTVGETDVFTVLLAVLTSPCVELPERLDDPALMVVSRPCTGTCMCMCMCVCVCVVGDGVGGFGCGCGCGEISFVWRSGSWDSKDPPLGGSHGGANS